jgi:RNA polymerase sigma-70 factor, ECF subfamily
MSAEGFDDLVTRAAAGEAAAFADLWRTANPALLRYLRVLAGGQAEDIASEAWLKVVRGLNAFDGDEAGFRAWIATIARRTFIDAQRRPGFGSEVPVAEVAELDRPVEQAPDAADLVLDRMSTRAALQLIHVLPKDQAEMIALRVIVGLDYPEVALIVGRSAGAVRVAVHRGLRRLELVLRDAAVSANPQEVLVSRHD